MTLTRLTAAMLFSASLWCGALVFFRVTLTGGWRGPEVWTFLPFAFAGLVTALFVAMQCVLASSPDPISQQRQHFSQEQNK
jgi:hypothetical protein